MENTKHIITVITGIIYKKQLRTRLFTGNGSYCTIQQVKNAPLFRDIQVHLKLHKNKKK